MPSDRTAPVRSMTGFAGIRRQISAGELNVTLRSVNHRGLDLHFHQIGEFGVFENAMRALLKERIRRGHVELRLNLTRQRPQEAALYNRTVLDAYLSAFRQACRDFKLQNDPDLNALFAFPGVFEPANKPDSIDEALEPELLATLSACIDELNEYREREGNALRLELQREVELIEQAVEEIRSLRTGLLPHLQTKLRERIAELLGSTAILEARIAEEAALLAERSDVAEELTRLSVHSAELRKMLEDGGEVGKRLDFLLQEMNREANTTLSKSSGGGEPGLRITKLALGLKANIERIREQALNLE